MSMMSMDSGFPEVHVLHDGGLQWMGTANRTVKLALAEAGGRGTTASNSRVIEAQGLSKPEITGTSPSVRGLTG
jgi:hypothetical protein